eukprot:gene4412-3211_t
MNIVMKPARNKTTHLILTYACMNMQKHCKNGQRRRERMNFFFFCRRQNSEELYNLFFCWRAPGLLQLMNNQRLIPSLSVVFAFASITLSLTLFCFCGGLASCSEIRTEHRWCWCVFSLLCSTKPLSYWLDLNSQELKFIACVPDALTSLRSEPLNTTIILRSYSEASPIFSPLSCAHKESVRTGKIFASTDSRTNSQDITQVSDGSTSSAETQEVEKEGDNYLLRLFSFLQQGLVAGFGAVMSIAVIFYLFSTPMKEDTVHHTAAMASDALQDANLRKRATEFTKLIVQDVLNDPHSLHLVAKLVTQLLAREDVKTAVSSLLQALSEDRYTQEMTKKFILALLQDPWVSDQLDILTAKQAHRLLQNEEVKSAFAKYIAEAASETLQKPDIHDYSASAIRSTLLQVSSLCSSIQMATSSVLAKEHTAFVHKMDEKTSMKTYHLKMSGVYWGLSALELLGTLDFEREKVVGFVLACYNDDGGFGGNKEMDSHLLYTLSALQLLCLYDAMSEIDVERTARYIASMQLPDGSFQGDCWGEVDSRFVYIAVHALALLRRLDLVDRNAAVEWTMRCCNVDGAFGVSPGSESHAGQVFCCLGALCILNALDRVDRNQLAMWLAMRQLPSGGLNGRPEKQADVCYSWWVVSSLSMLRATDWIDKHKLFQYILACQDPSGGIADKPGNMPDVYHTFFGLCGLSLLGYDGYSLGDINPVYALPFSCLERVGITEAEGLNVGRKG